jgi:D-alanyl-D-alanine carboxypeptidase
VTYGLCARRIGVLAAVGALVGGASAFGASGAGAASPSGACAASGPLPAQTEAKVRRIVQRFRDVNRTPGVLVGIWSPRGIFVRASGDADLATGKPLKAGMQFKIASQTKTFTANLILQLVGEGKVSLGDHVSKWIAGVPNGDRITIRELLNHTSGLGEASRSRPSSRSWPPAVPSTSCSRSRRRRLRSRRPA